MKLRFIKAAAATAIAAAAVLAVPVAANAYPAADPDIAVSGTLTPGSTVTVTAEPGTFVAGETVTIFLSGESASGASLAFVKFAYEANANLGTTTAAADGALATGIKLPSNASGEYTVTAVGASGATATTSFTISATGSGTGLPDTGGDSGALLGLWIGGGALVLAGTGVAVASTVRRQRQGAATAA